MKRILEILFSSVLKDTMITIEEVFAEAQIKDRVCPLPMKWDQLYKMLLRKHHKGTGMKPSPPLILAGWVYTTGLCKTLRLREHIEWADANGCLTEVYSFLHNLPEEDWYHYRSKA